MSVLCVIPARIASTRLARKPLAMIGDKPMVLRTYQAACCCKDIDQVIVATDNEEVADTVRAMEGQIEMTDPEIKTGSDRVAVVSARYPQHDIVINLQGDEPFVHADSLSALIKSFVDNAVEMATLAYPLNFESDYIDPNVVKVICNRYGNAIYFSRAPIPHFREGRAEAAVLHHMGVYAYRREFLKIYTGLPKTPLEQAESLEQLRVLEHGYAIRVVNTPHRAFEINTPEELAEAQNWV